MPDARASGHSPLARRAIQTLLLAALALLSLGSTCLLTSAGAQPQGTAVPLTWQASTTLVPSNTPECTECEAIHRANRTAVAARLLTATAIGPRPTLAQVSTMSPRSTGLYLQVLSGAALVLMAACALWVWHRLRVSRRA